MKLILNNPYRTVGLLVGATAREQDRQVRRLKQLIEAEQDQEDDFSFPTLGHLHRTAESVSDAASKLNLDSDKMSAALFWFYNGNPITDEPAFDAIKEADLDQVINIWQKLTSNGEVSQRNASAYSNLGTLYLSGILEGTNTNEAILEQGISLKLKFLESDFIKDFKAIATDETFKTTKKELQLLFLNQVQSEVEKSGTVTSNKFLNIVKNHEFSAKDDFLKGFVQKPIEQIEKKIDEAKAKRKVNKSNAINVGKELFEQTTENIKQLKSILGSSNLKFSTISDKVSDEVLQCGIDYFKICKDNNESHSGIPKEHSKYTGEESQDFAAASMDLFHKAKTLAVGNIAKQRCQENTENLQEWIDKKPEREKKLKIQTELDGLIEIFQEFDSKEENIENAMSLISVCKSKLEKIKTNLGATDELYLKLSTRVATQAQSFIIDEVNGAQEDLDDLSANERYAAIIKLKYTLTKAWTAITAIGTLDMEIDFKKNRYNRNKESLRVLCNQLNVSTFASSTSNTSNSSTSNRSNASSSNNTNTSNTQSDFELAENAWWILGFIGLVIGLVAMSNNPTSDSTGILIAALGGAIFGAYVGRGIGNLLKK